MYKILLLVVISLVSCTGNRATGEKILITVKRNYVIPKESEEARIVIDWKTLLAHLPKLRSRSFTITDQNFGKEITARLTGSKKSTPENLVFDYTFNSNEPVFSFLIVTGGNKHDVSLELVQADSRLIVSFLKALPKREEIKDVASRLIESTMNLYPNVKDFPIYNPDKWNYEYSFFMAGAFKQGKKINNDAYVNYARQWLDSFITEEGSFRKGVYKMKEYKLDDILPGRLVINLHQETNLPQYKSIADTLLHQLSNTPKTSDGGYWHKEIYPSQMWLDGIFMGDVFSMQYAQAYNKPVWFDEAAHQIKLIYYHAVDLSTGLLYHGWDESKNPVWAHPERGTSPEFWGRAVGWYCMALVECLDYLPTDHPARNDVIEILKNVASSVYKYQDANSHLWYQVLDKGNHSGNWIETSCSAMFAYTFAKGYHQGHLDKIFLTAAERAYNSILNNYVYVDENGNLHLDQTVKIGTLNPKNSKGDYEYYITTERRINDYKGLAALLYASIELGR